MNHAELVIRATGWLKNFFHCRVILSELVAYTNSCETPDAIGWVHNRAILVECKATVDDFRADLKKRARHPLMPALGAWRFCLTPPDLLKSENLIRGYQGWGLYEVHDRRIVHVGGIEYSNAARPPFESDRNSEVAMLVSALSRISNDN